MIGKKKINQIKSLAQKKFRQKEQLFLVEGDKIVSEVLTSHLVIKELFATKEFLEKNKSTLSGIEKIFEINLTDIKKASLLKTPQNCLALCSLPVDIPLPQKLSGISFFLDGIQDPGNLGTIIRTSDWFGMEYLFCSCDTADVYNPKVIQSSMGSFCRIKVHYLNFADLNSLALHSEIPVLGTFMEGTSLYSSILPSSALVVLGNEGNGIRFDIAEKISTKLNIPPFYNGKKGAESLNVAVTAGIIGSEFRRQLIKRISIQNEN